jgi:putative tricarboxylic transport membrane protein
LRTASIGHIPADELPVRHSPREAKMPVNSSSFARLSRRALTATIMAGTLALALPAQAEIKSLDIIAPANPGGGWDQTARAIQAALEAEKLASGVKVENIGGAGGTIGLAQFVSSRGKKGDAILVGGLVMVGAILTNKSPVTLANVAPLARLTGEYELIVVPTESPLQNMGDLTAKLKADPGSVSWGGGSAGGTDHILAGLIAKAAGVDPTKVNYIAHSGGGEALSAILGGHVTAGISGYEEFAPQIAAGKLRALAISADERLPGIDVPTLKEQGIDVSLVNWRGLFAGANAKEKDVKALSDAVAKMVESPAWQDTLKQRGWINLYQPADEFTAFLADDQAKVETTLKAIGLVQ